MKVSFWERPSKPPSPESCTVGREAGGEALTGECAGRVLSREIDFFGMPTPFTTWKAIRRVPICEACAGSARSETPSTHRNLLHGSPSREVAEPPVAAYGPILSRESPSITGQAVASSIHKSMRGARYCHREVGRTALWLA